MRGSGSKFEMATISAGTPLESNRTFCESVSRDAIRHDTAAQQIVGPEPREATFASNVIPAKVLGSAVARSTQPLGNPFSLVTVDWLIKILGALGGFVGTGLGIYNFIHARRQERSAREAEEKDWRMSLTLRVGMLVTDANAFVPDEGSEEHRWAERMVAKNLLHRGVDGNGYTLPRGT
jgi:hypothetical protein